MIDELVKQASARFRELYGRDPTVASWAPGRVELLGNHTDYNGGYVLPVAVDRYTVVVAAPRSDRQARVYGMNVGEGVAFDVGQVSRDPQHRWADYVKGVIGQLRQAGVGVEGFEACIVGDVPVAAGLSSSASIEVAVAMMVQALFGFQMDRLELAQLVRRAENEFVGVNCGILDMFSSLFGQADAAMFLDCATLAHEVVAFPGPAPAVVICNSMTSRSLADGMYNRRRSECEAAVAYFRRVLGRPVRFLRDVRWEEFLEHESRLEPAWAARVRHVLEENRRVMEGLAAVREGRLDDLGRLMFESHASSRDLFENSSPHLNVLVEIARGSPGVIGAKLSGGGWAGCTVNLVRPEAVDAFVAHVVAHYQSRMHLTADVYPCRPAAGASFRRWA